MEVISHEAVFEKPGEGFYGFRKYADGGYGEYLFKNLQLSQTGPVIHSRWFSPVWVGRPDLKQKCFTSKKALLSAMARNAK